MYEYCEFSLDKNTNLIGQFEEQILTTDTLEQTLFPLK